jgi:fructokinase
MTIVCLGEAIVDLVCEEPLASPDDAGSFIPHPGGALANVAVAASRAGADAALLGGVGDDPWGHWLRSRLAGEGVGVEWTAVAAELTTPLALVTFGPDFEPSFQLYGESIGPAMRAAREHMPVALAGGSAFVFGSNTLVGEPERELTVSARRAARDRDLPILFDPNLRPNRWRSMDRAVTVCRELCDGAFAVKTTSEEAELLTGKSDPADAAAALCGLGAQIGVVTRGAAGALMRGAADGEADAPRIEVVSPLGAGDAFMGALAAGLAKAGWDPARAAEALPGAVAAGARACSGWGAQA